DPMVADCAHERVVLVELEQLRFADAVALKREQVTFRADCDRRDATAALGERKWIRIGEPEIGRTHLVRDDVPLASPRADGRVTTRLRAAVALDGLGSRDSGRRLICGRLEECGRRGNKRERGDAGG